MVERSLDFAARAMAGSLEGAPPEAIWSGAVLDSRQVRGSELFFALAGERTDGHRFVAAALAAGAAAAVVRGGHTESQEGAVIRVDEPFAALHDLTRAVRAQVPRRLVAVTGSTGKTTTKELLAAMLGRRFRVARNPGNLNNLYGFPIALLGIPDDTECLVAEMGMSKPGELASLSRLGAPDVAILLNVRPVHLEFFDSLAAIAEAKAEILEGLAPEGFVVGNRDDAEIRRVLEASRARVVWFGRSGEAAVRADDVGPLGDGRPGSRFTLVTPAGRIAVELPLHGSFHVDNCLAAAACASELGVPLADIAAAAAGITPAPMRGEVTRLRSGATLIDDSYNSNPEALVLALESAASLPGERRWAVLGDMLELGPRSPEFHREAGE
ncbi:MAG: UDP-N-acetylmuramoyl-tripeptide--D-alanyl-D-alanine ligase, partial [Thermoanaerobaculia bacterium]